METLDKKIIFFLPSDNLKRAETEAALGGQSEWFKKRERRER